MKQLILFSCILCVAVANPVRRSASESSSNERILLPMLRPFQTGPLQPPVNQPLGPPQSVPVIVYYDPAQGNPPVVGPGSPVLSPFPGYPVYPPVVGPGSPVLSPFPGYPFIPPALGK